MKFRHRSLFTLFFIVLFGYALVAAGDLPFATKLYPITIASAGLILTLVRLALDSRVKVNSAWSEKEELDGMTWDKTVPRAVIYKKAAKIGAWILGLYFGMWLLGYKISFALFFFLLMKVEGRGGWLISAGITAAGVFLIIIQLEKTLQLYWPEGILWQWLNLPWAW